MPGSEPQERAARRIQISDELRPKSASARGLTTHLPSTKNIKNNTVGL